MACSLSPRLSAPGQTTPPLSLAPRGGPLLMSTRRGKRAGRHLGTLALARTYTGDYPSRKKDAQPAEHEFALLAGTPDGPQPVRTTLTNATRRDPKSYGLLSMVPDREPEPIFR